MLRRLFLALAVLLVAAPAMAQDVAQQTAQTEAGVRVTSPDGSIRVSLSVDNDGRVNYRVDRGGAEIIAPSRLGFILADADKLERPAMTRPGSCPGANAARWSTVTTNCACI